MNTFNRNTTFTIPSITEATISSFGSVKKCARHKKIPKAVAKFGTVIPAKLLIPPKC